MARFALTDDVSILRQAANRSLLADALQDGRLVQEVVVDPSGYFKVEHIEWDKYWSNSLVGISDQIRSGLDLLRTAWQAYCQSDYDLKLAALYCCRHFERLRLALAGNLSRRFLDALAGFEVFPIRLFHSSGAEAAGVITVRHPAYLLAKLRKPNVPDDPKYLPLVHLPLSGPASASGNFYYHYRQLKFDSRHNASVLVYPAADLGRRLDSFGCIDDAVRHGNHIFFPLRRLNQGALRLDDGRCLLEQLAAIADLVVIEDVDIDADQLYDYLDLGNPKELAASDATDRRRMQLSNLLCFSRREHADLLPGDRLW